MVEKERDTDDLRSGLMDDNDIRSYLQENRDNFSQWDVAELLAELYGKRDISKAELARKAGMSEVYLHQIFSGRRKASRDKLICFCIGLDISLEETQKLLERAAYARLYPRIKRDAIISHGILHGTPLEEINDILFVENEKTLC